MHKQLLKLNSILTLGNGIRLGVAFTILWSIAMVVFKFLMFSTKFVLKTSGLFRK